MKITYLHHSAFLIELKHHLLLFDWVNTPLCELPKDKPLYVFVSHHHEDHFHEAIFTLAKIHPDVHYLISDDVPCKDRKDVLVCACDQIYEVDDLQVKTIASTDEGVAFLVMCEQNIIYHAGDLNWWDWGEEDSEEEAQQMETAYRKAMKKLSRYQMDVAFLPVDPRLIKGFYKGVSCFMQYSDAKHIIPMHMWDQYDIVEKLCKRDEVKAYAKRIQKIRKDIETFTI